MDFRTLREEVFKANKELAQAGLVAMSRGNASGICRESGLVIIKPSGIDYRVMRPEDLAVLDLEGKPVPASKVPDGVASSLVPSVDTPIHLALYRKDARIGGIVHTYSNYATAWAAVGQAIPCALTAMADEFGDEIPCMPYIDNQGENIANGIMRFRGRGPAILLANHGVMAFDRTPAKAFQAAVMVEDAAKTLLLSRALGTVKPLPLDEIEKWWSRYHNAYGQ